MKLTGSVAYLASIFSGVGTKVRKDGLAAYVDLDFTEFSVLSNYDPSVQRLLAQSTVDGTFGVVSISQVIAGSQTFQVVTSGSVVNVAVTDGLIIINKSSGSPTSVNMPPSAAKIGKCKIVDFKGDASTNNITVNASGSEKFNGNFGSWLIASDTGSIVLDPIVNGLGYAV